MIVEPTYIFRNRQFRFHSKPLCFDENDQRIMYFMPLYLPKVPSERKKVPGLIDICDISTNVYVSE